MPIWFVKLVAALMVLFASSMTGFTVAKSYRERPRELRALQSVLQGLSTEITYGRTPLPEAFWRLSQASPEPIARLFRRAAAVLGQPGATADEAWRDGLAELAPHSTLQAADLELLAQLGGLLGLSDPADQERHLLLLIQQLGREEARAEQLRQSNERMWRYLGVLSGLLVVIVLI